MTGGRAGGRLKAHFIPPCTPLTQEDWAEPARVGGGYRSGFRSPGAYIWAHEMWSRWWGSHPSDPSHAATEGPQEWPADGRLTE
ncbi:hypothetical protein NDU88_003699 [Pleurodeles waltl]|uniref:Uncharacterized protein n=1 Tax=Pleurodeles waltl TaxID=8319 RepID=A0AAV7TPV8_PLEWA|nr:hypothetical protein NDU88_003699 [Pleurodeles waltl]